MAKRKSNSTKKALNPFVGKKWTKKELEDSELWCSLPFVKDTRGEAYHEDAGLYWWHVTDPIYWHQGVSVGEAFADRVAVVLPKNPKLIEEVLCHSLHDMLRQGGSNGIAMGFLQRMAHYACIGMQREGGAA